MTIVILEEIFEIIGLGSSKVWDGVFMENSPIGEAGLVRVHEDGSCFWEASGLPVQGFDEEHGPCWAMLSKGEIARLA